MPIESEVDLTATILRVAAVYCIASFALTVLAGFAMWAARAWRYWMLAYRSTRRAVAAERQAGILRARAKEAAAAREWARMLRDAKAGGRR